MRDEQTEPDAPAPVTPSEPATPPPASTPDRPPEQGIPGGSQIEIKTLVRPERVRRGNDE